MSEPEVEIPYVGGPYDGTTAKVTLDSDGRPPEFPTTSRFAQMDFSVDATSGPMGDVLTQLYELDSELTPGGVRFVYRFTGEVSHRGRRAAA